MRTLLVLCILVLGGCHTIIAGQMHDDTAQHVEWERQNFEREKAGMPLLTFKDWQEKNRAAGKSPEALKAEAERKRHEAPGEM